MINQAGTMCRFIVPDHAGSLFPAEEGPLCWMKFKGFPESTWWPCLRIRSPDNIRKISPGAATIEVALPSEWRNRFVSSRINLTAPKFQILREELKINIELVNAAMPLPEVTLRFYKDAFSRLLQYGVQQELGIEKSEIDAFNYDKMGFDCWLLKCNPIYSEDSEKLQQWTMVVNTRGAPDQFPPVLEWYHIGFVLPSAEDELQTDLYVFPESKRARGFIDMERRGDLHENLTLKGEKLDEKLDSYATFNVTLPVKLSRPMNSWRV